MADSPSSKRRRRPAETRYSPYFPFVRKTNNVKVSTKSSSQIRDAVAETKRRKFGDKTEEEVMKLLLPDRLGDNLDILFVGINPGLMSAYQGHHYSGPNNHFWPCLTGAGLVPKDFTFVDDHRCPSYGIGLTNIVARTTRSSSDLSRTEIKDGKENLLAKVKHYKPLITVFNGKGFDQRQSATELQQLQLHGNQALGFNSPLGTCDLLDYLLDYWDIRSRIAASTEVLGILNKSHASEGESLYNGIYEVFCGKKCVLGRQDEKIPDSNSVVYVMPSSSARTMTFPRKDDKLHFFLEVKKLRDVLKRAVNSVE